LNYNNIIKNYLEIINFILNDTNLAKSVFNKLTNKKIIENKRNIRIEKRNIRIEERLINTINQKLVDDYLQNSNKYKKDLLNFFSKIKKTLIYLFNEKEGKEIFEAIFKEINIKIKNMQ